jgi:hypothetical protein
MSKSDHGLPPGSTPAWRVLALGSGIGALMLGAGEAPLSLVILLLVVAFVSSSVLLAGGSYGPEVEGHLDLSARLGLGLLGGVIGATATAVVRLALAEIGVDDVMGVTLPSGWAGQTFLVHLGSGAMWGMVFGVIYGYVPGGSPSTRGILFSLAPTVYLLLKVYPVDRDLGLFGVELGALTFLFVAILNLCWGSIVGVTIGWGDVGEDAPVARPIDA